jgi:hypothetical protein
MAKYRTFKQLSFGDFSKATWRSINPSLAPLNSVKLALNFDSDEELGALVSRLGTVIIGTQQADDKRCYGLHHFRDSVGTAHKVFAVFPGASTQTVYDLLDGTADLTGDTNNKKTRFLTYLDSCLRVNGTDAAKAWNGTTWVTTGGAFDLANIPSGASLAIEWKDRVYLSGFSSDPDAVKYSGIADPNTRAVSWTSGNGTLYFEQEDGGGGIVALAKVPGYLLTFKRRTFHRYDGSSTYPDSLMRQGTISQETVCTTRGMCIFFNEKGVWATTGGLPKRISKPVKDFIEAIPAANLSEVYMHADEEHVYVCIGDVTVGDNDYSNVVLKFNLDDSAWDVRSYSHPLYFMTEYIGSNNERLIMFGDDDGNVLQLDSGYTDYKATGGQPITLEFEPQDLDFGYRGKKKSVSRMVFYTEGMSKAKSLYRLDSHNASEWKPLGKIDEEIKELIDKTMTFNYLNLTVVDTCGTGRHKVYSFEFLSDEIKLHENTK